MLELGQQDIHAHQKIARANGLDQNLSLVTTQAQMGKGPLDPLVKPSYYVTEPPDNPISGPAQSGGSEANTEEVQQLALKNPIPSSFTKKQPYLLDGLLSKGLTQLSLKRKEVDDDSTNLLQVKCLRKEGQDHPTERVVQNILPLPNIELQKTQLDREKTKWGKRGSPRVKKSTSTTQGLIAVQIVEAEGVLAVLVTYPVSVNPSCIISDKNLL
ncbi:hypothetical protein LOK49_LG11G01331 [Camellia lanceoleosa]|uniref:Uncharacterized protein n=1 Tax=Camellia lanceoleosa TaxID=1840588 RepID=A0ACC0G7D4_9ERIC|nr:hypothetical protein LOK49_LG11G01331 [Camellia lanceoleosa]